MKRIIIASLFTFLILSCSNTKIVRLTEGGKNVKISSILPPGFCEELSEVYAHVEGPSSKLKKLVKSLRNKMRNSAARNEVNYVAVDSTHSVPTGSSVQLMMTGTGYRCRAKSAGRKNLNNKILPMSP